MNKATFYSNIGTWYQSLLVRRFKFSQDIDISHDSKFWFIRINGRVVFKILIDHDLFSNQLSDLKFKWFPTYPLFLDHPDDCIGALYSSKCSFNSLISYSADIPVVSCDFICFSFMLCSCYQDNYSNSFSQDAHDRLDVCSTLNYKFSFLETPIVDQWADIFRIYMNRSGFLVRYRHKNHKVLLTHDIDRPSRYDFLRPLQALKLFVKALFFNDKSISLRTLLLALNPFNTQISHKDPYNTFDELMTIASKHNLCSIFFLPVFSDSPYDCFFNINNFKIKSLVKSILENGHVIGLHTSYNGQYSLAQYTNESVKLVNYLKIFGNCTHTCFHQRAHYLRFNHKLNMSSIHTVQMTEHSLGFTSKPGFRCGTSHEFDAVCPVTAELLGYTHQPLLVMDHSLISQNVNDDAEIIKTLIKIATSTIAYNGVFSILIHNNMLYSPGLKDKLFTLLGFLIND